MTIALKNAAFVALALAGSAYGIERIQPRLASKTHDVKQRDDAYLFPPPAELRAMVLGYRAPVADYLWARMIVEYGTHWVEKREWTDAPRYMDAILTLEPGYPLVYRFADTIIVYRPMRGTEEDVRTARKFMERGTRERPLDHEVWMHYGQFIAFTAPSFLTSSEEIDQWRREGAGAMAHAVELGGEADRSITVATILGKTGERKAGIKQLQHAYALTDDEETRKQILGKLTVLQATAEREETEKDVRFIEARWRKEYGFIPRDEYLLIGPITDPASCAGRATAKALGGPRCPATWQEALPSYTAKTP